MADIFISYAREDRAQARGLAEALGAQGWEVWWDRRIPPGQDFVTFIQRQLESARCLVVLWSKASVASEYVRDEAGDAKDRNALVPALIDDVKPPLGFRQRHVANLTAWTGDVLDPEFIALVDAIASLVPRPVKVEEESPSPRGQQPASGVNLPTSTADFAGHAGSVATETLRKATTEPRRRGVQPAVAERGAPQTSDAARDTTHVRRRLSRRSYLLALAASVAVLALAGKVMMGVLNPPPSRTPTGR